MSTQAKEILEKKIYKYFKDGHVPDPKDAKEAFLRHEDRTMAILAAMQEYADLEKKELQQEVDQLRRWKREQMEVWGPLSEYGQTMDIKLGSSIPAAMLNRLQEYQQVKERAAVYKNALDKILAMPVSLNNVGRADMIDEIKKIASKALASWKEDHPQKPVVEIEYMPILSVDRRISGCPVEVPIPMLDNYTAQANHGQDLKKLKSRGGLGVHEALAIMDKTSYKVLQHLSMDQAIAELKRRLTAWKEDQTKEVNHE
jgi:hypothetical protein